MSIGVVGLRARGDSIRQAFDELMAEMQRHDIDPTDGEIVIKCDSVSHVVPVGIFIAEWRAV